jgi:hypothetical protein
MKMGIPSFNISLFHNMSLQELEQELDANQINAGMRM